MEIYSRNAWKVNLIAIAVLALAFILHTPPAGCGLDSVESQFSTQIGFRNGSGTRVYRMRSDGSGDNSFNFSDLNGSIVTLSGGSLTFSRTINGIQLLVNGTSVLVDTDPLNLSIDIVPSANATYDIGNPDSRWNKTYAVHGYVNETCYNVDCTARILYNETSGNIELKTPP